MRESSSVPICVSMQCFEMIVRMQEGANHRVRKVRKILNFYALQPYKLDLRSQFPHELTWRVSLPASPE
jgi:hypothetical protein